MGRKKRWNWGLPEDGISTVELYSWDYYTDFVYDVLLDYKSYVYRGHRKDDWKLESTFDRLHRNRSQQAKESALKRHIEEFKYASRGRRGSHPPRIESENDWWALGQHFGLATPLLDWTGSPFVAAFFAFEKKKHDDTQKRVIFAIHQGLVEKRAREILSAEGSAGDPQVTFFRPLSDENSRLVNQGGLFTRIPLGVDLESWVKGKFDGEKKNVLIKIRIPSSGRELCLKELNRMNINYLTLFPDVFGASLHCNTALSIYGY